MTALAAEFGLLSLLLTDLAAVLPPLATFGDRARAGGVGALLKGFSHGHLLSEHVTTGLPPMRNADPNLCRNAVGMRARCWQWDECYFAGAIDWTVILFAFVSTAPVTTTRLPANSAGAF